MTTGIDMLVKAEGIRHLPDRPPEGVSEHAGESRCMLFVGELPVRLVVMVVAEEPFTGSSEGCEGGTRMSSEDTLLPEVIEAFNGSIPARLSRWDEDHMSRCSRMAWDRLYR